MLLFFLVHWLSQYFFWREIMEKLHCKMILLFFAITLLLITPTFALAQEDFQKPDELVLKSEAVVKSFLSDPDMEWFRNNLPKARGVFIVPQMIRGGFILGGSGGSGLLLAQDYKTGAWSQPVFYSMGSVSFGLQIGADASEIILLIMTDKGLDAMMSKEFKLGADAAVAAGPVGGSAKAQTADILAFGRAKGAYAGLSVEGALISPRDKWNNSYYGTPVRPVDIIVRGLVHNPKADTLVNAMPTTNSKVLGK
jgi:lipid-binding SYLF domain-containing protein